MSGHVATNATAADVRKAILSQFHGDRYVVAFEVGDDTGVQGLRRCDAMVMHCWPSDRHRILGLEIKVSRSDWLNELKDAGKSETFARHCDQFGLVAPIGVVQPGEIPTGWGYWQLQRDGRLRCGIKPIQRTDRLPMPAGMIASMMRRACVAARKELGTDRAELRADVEKAVAAEVAQLRTRIQELENELRGQRGAAAAMRERIAGSSWASEAQLDAAIRVAGAVLTGTPATLLNRIAVIIEDVERATASLRLAKDALSAASQLDVPA